MTATETCTRRPGALWSGCRCTQCRARHARLCKQNRLGLLPKLRADDARAVLDSLVARGWGATAIASATHLQVATVHALVEGRHQSMSHATARALLAVGDPTTGFVGAFSTRRRLRALAVAGWPLRAISQEMGLPMMSVYKARDGLVETLQVANWVTVRDNYPTLAAQAGPSAVVARRAVALGWEPPAAWDEESLEDPAELVPVALADDSVLIERIAAGALQLVATTFEDRLALVPVLHERGMSDGEIGSALGCCDDSIMRIRRRLGVGGRYAA